MESGKERIYVIDSHCGSGKTSYAIQYINKLPNTEKVIYITPFLKECERIKISCTKKNFYTPDIRKGRGSKLVNFMSLIKSGKNIVSTHVLFSRITDEIITEIKNNNYILILDEVMNVINKVNLYEDNKRLDDEGKDKIMKADIRSLIKTGIIEVTEDGLVKWSNPDVSLARYDLIKNLADRGLLYVIANNFIIWTFPIDVFREGVFKTIFILTYMFDYQMQAYYYNYFNLPYTKYIVKETDTRIYEIFPMDQYSSYDKEWKKSIQGLIHICNHKKLNENGNGYKYAKTSLSKSWYTKADEETLKKLNLNISNYYKNIIKVKTEKRMWTCFKSCKNVFKGNNELSKKGWVELNARATNDYSNKSVLVYPINRYLNPFYEKFLSKRNISINQDGYALSEFVQWIFRSAIRNGEQIYIYCPSQRMRSFNVEDAVNLNHEKCR